MTNAGAKPTRKKGVIGTLSVVGALFVPPFLFLMNGGLKFITGAEDLPRLWDKVPDSFFSRPSGPASPFFDIRTGRLGPPVDKKLAITTISYELENCFVSISAPSTLNVSTLPVAYVQEQHSWKIRTAQLVDAGAAWRALPHVPARVIVDVTGIEQGESASLHVLTDDEYVIPVSGINPDGTARVHAVIGSPGFSAFVDQSEISAPRLRSEPLDNMLRSDAGPIAVLVVSATRGQRVRRSRTTAVLRKGVREPDDTGILEGHLASAFVSSDLPPLVVFQSTRACGSPHLHAIYASTLDGNEIFQISSPHPAENTLSRVEPGPPASIYFRSNYETKAERLCYRVRLTRAPIPPPERVALDACTDPRAHP